MSYSIKTFAQDGSSTYDPSVNNPMVFVGSYSIPSYVAPNSSSITVTGIRNDGNWFLLPTSNAAGLYTTISISNDTVTSTTVSPSTATISQFDFDVFRNNLTTAPSSGYGFWVKNDAGYISAQTSSTTYQVFSSGVTSGSTFSLPSGLPAGSNIAAKPLNATSGAYITWNLQTSVLTCSNGQMEYLIVCKSSSIPKETSGNGIQILDSSGNLTWSSNYKNLVSTGLFTFTTTGTAQSWSLSNTKAYVLFSGLGFQYCQIAKPSPGANIGYFLQKVPTWNNDYSGSSVLVPAQFNGPPTDTNWSTGSVNHFMFEI